MTKIALVDGANGLIGYALIKKLLYENFIVHALVRKSSNIKHLINLSSGIIFHYCELEDYEHFDPTFNVDIVFHLAWRGTDKLSREDSVIQYENIEFSLSVVRLAKKLGAITFVGIGSQDEFSSVLIPYNDDTRIDPNNHYGIAKFAAGKATKILCDSLNLKHVWIRVFSVYGPYDNHQRLIPQIIESIKFSKTLQINNGHQVWDYLYVDDVANAIYLLALEGKHGKSYSLGSGIERTIRDYIEIIQKIEGVILEVVYNINDESCQIRPFLLSCNTELYLDTGIKFDFDFRTGFIETLRKY